MNLNIVLFKYFTFFDGTEIRKSKVIIVKYENAITLKYLQTYYFVIFLLQTYGILLDIVLPTVTKTVFNVIAI